MASATLTLMGMYHWDDTLFEKMVLPEGIDKDLLIQTLLLRGAEFEVLYSDPDFMKTAIGVWSNKWFRTFAEWLRGTQATWNPIHNYDRFEESKDDSHRKTDNKVSADFTDTRTPDLTETRTPDLTETRTPDLTETRTPDLTHERTDDLTEERTPDVTNETTFDNTDTTSQTVDSTTQHDVSAYDASGYVPSSKDTINNGSSNVAHTGTVTGTETGTDTTTHTGTETTTETGTDTTTTTGTDTTTTTGTDTTTTSGTDSTRRAGTLSDQNGNEYNTTLHGAHIYGNIGVTQASDMLRSFYDISAWNLYDHISDVFVNELLIPVY